MKTEDEKNNNLDNSYDDRIHDPVSELPYVLQTADVAKILNVCNKTALKVIRGAEKKGVRVLWIGKGNQPRLNRDAFLAWLRGAEN